MNETIEDLKRQMRLAAERLHTLEGWNCGEGYRFNLLEVMQQGGENATEAWVILLKEVVKLPPAIRGDAETLLTQYQQSIGRWYLAVHNNTGPSLLSTARAWEKRPIVSEPDNARPN